MVLDRAGDEDDPLAQQPRIDVEAALAPVGLLDDDGDELRDDVLMVDHGNADPLVVVRAYIGRIGERFKPGQEAKGGSTAFGGPPSPRNRGTARRRAAPRRTALLNAAAGCQYFTARRA